MTSGFIKLQRRSFSHWLWEEDRSLSKFEAWLDLLQLAAFVPTKRLVKGKFIELGEGEVIASTRYLGERWKWNKNKVSGFMVMLEADQMLLRKTGQGETVLSICNYRKYNTEQDTNRYTNRDRDGTATGQAPVQSIRREEGKKGKGVKAPPAPASADAWEDPEDETYPEKSNTLCTIQQARDYAPICKMTPAQAEHWWHTRNSAGWTKGSSGGGNPRKITSWQSDMAMSLSWVGESLEKMKHAMTGKDSTKTKATSAAQYGI